MMNKYNGTRKYLVDFSQSIMYMGSYHFLDGEVVKISYRGNVETCGRCHKSAKKCPGGGKKKECREAGGSFVHISEHMKDLWQSIGFVPTGFELPTQDIESAEIGELSQPNSSTNPACVDKAVEKTRSILKQDSTKLQKYDGINNTNFPLSVSESEVLKFLFEKGLPQTTDKTKVKFIKSERNMKVSIEDSLGWKSVHTLLQNIHFHECNEKFWNVPLYCKPIRTLTPVKQNPNAGPSKDDDISDKVSNTVPMHRSQTHMLMIMFLVM